MSEIVWTKDQQRAIDIRNKNVLVSAAAGSGKTALLTERLKNLVLNDGIDCTNLLVLTFTRAAATEMKQRFKQKLFDSLKEGDWKLSENEILDQINYLTDAQISTIHSFAQSMIRRYFQVLNIDPDFRIADESELRILTDQVIEDVFEELFAEHETNPTEETKKFVELANVYGGAITNDHLKDLVKDLRGNLLKLTNPEEWMSTFTFSIAQIDEESLFELEALKPLFEDIRSTLNVVQEKYNIIAREVPNITGWKDTAKGKIQIEKELDWFEALQNVNDNKSLLNYLKEFPVGRVTFPKSGGELSEKLKNIRGNKTENGAYHDICTLVDFAKEIDLDAEYFKTKELARLFKNLYDLTKYINSRITEKKLEMNVLDFDDLEHYLLELLENDHIRKNIQDQFQFIYLDEAQDTNGIQEAILEEIRSGNNRFIVGDIKQSIYRFRNADPTILIDKYFSFEKDKNSELVLLNQNFRSTPEIVDAINSIFERIMTTKLGEIEYNDEARLIATRDSNNIKPEINIIELERFDDKDQIQALLIAEKIRELKKEGFKNNQIGILYSTINKKVQKILKVLAQEGIPVRFEGNGVEVKTKEVDTFLKLLQLIDNHKQDIPLLTIMNLPIYGFTLDEQSQIRLVYPDEPYYYQAVERYMTEQNDALAEKLRDFYDTLDRYRDESKHIEIDDFIWQLMLDSGIYNYFGNMDGGIERKANLRLLLERAKNYKETSLKGITSFLDFVNELEKSGQSLETGNISAESDDVVKVMSIHKSKGLEFDVVFVADLNHQFRPVSTSNFFFHKDYGFGGKYVENKEGVLIKSKTLLEESLKTQLRNEELSEDLRLLYVAMTRARDRLFLIGAVDNISRESKIWSQGDSPEQLLQSKSMLNWIMRAIYNSPDFDPIELKTNSWDINYLTSKQVKEDINKEVQAKVVKDDEYYHLKDLIYQQLDKEEPEHINTKPMKLSVSRVKHKEIVDQEIIDLVPLENTKTSFTPAEIGTATHKIMQEIDFEKVLNSGELYEAVVKEIDRIAKDGYIPAEIIPDIDPGEIMFYLNSDIGNRFIKALNTDPDNVLKEFPFLYDTDINEVYDFGLNRPVELTGVIDLCFLEGNKWILVDFKTDRYINEELWNKRLKEYTTQLNLYEKALADLTGIEVKEKHLVLLSQKVDQIIN